MGMCMHRARIGPWGGRRMCVLRDQQGARVVSAQGVWEEGKEMSSETSAKLSGGDVWGVRFHSQGRMAPLDGLSH